MQGPSLGAIPAGAVTKSSYTPPENERMYPENQWLEGVFPIEIVPV